MEGHRLLKRESIFEGKVVRLYLDKIMLPDGREAEREVVHHWGAVGIVPLVERRELVLVEQYRHAPGESLMEIPAGKLLPGEDPLECAKRELEEEVGMKAGRWGFLCRFYTSPGFSNEMLHLYLAEELYEGDACPDDDEFLKVHKLTLEKAYAMVREGSVRDSKTIVGILAACLIAGMRAPI